MSRPSRRPRRARDPLPAPTPTPVSDVTRLCAAIDQAIARSIVSGVWPADVPPVEVDLRMGTRDVADALDGYLRVGYQVTATGRPPDAGDRRFQIRCRVQIRPSAGAVA